MNIRFRLAIPNDIESLNKISVKSKRYWGYPDDWIEKWRDELTLDIKKFNQQNILALEINNEIVGFCSIIENPEHYEIVHLWILPKYIGLGYGKKLLCDTLEKFTDSDKPVIVESDPNAEEFYKSQGFATFDKKESYPKGRFLPVMKRPVN